MMSPTYSPDGAALGDPSDLTLMTVITQPLPNATVDNFRRSLLGDQPSAVAGSAVATRHRSLLQQSSTNSITIAPLTIPFPSSSPDAEDFIYFTYDKFTGTPDYVDLSYFFYDEYYDDAVDASHTIFTVSGNGVGSNCVSSTNSTGCPASDSFSFLLHYVGDRVYGQDDYEYFQGYNVSLSFAQASGPYRSSAKEVYQPYGGDSYPPFVITAGGTDGNTSPGRRLQQVMIFLQRVYGTLCEDMLLVMVTSSFHIRSTKHGLRFIIVGCSGCLRGTSPV